MAHSRGPYCKWLTGPNIAALLLAGAGFWLCRAGGPIQAAGPTSQGATHTDDKQVDAALTEIRTALARRNFTAAKKQLEDFDAANASDAQKAQLQALRKCNLLLLEFWKAVRSAASQMQPLDEIVLDNQPIAVVAEASRESLSLKLGAETKQFTYDKLPPDVAWGIALRCMPIERAANKAILGAFLAFDPQGDRSAAGDLWSAAHRAGLDTADLMPELDQPLPPGLSGPTNFAAASLVKPGTPRGSSGNRPAKTEVAAKPGRSRPAPTIEKPADAGASAQPPTPGKPIDLLKAVRLPQDRVRGVVSLENGALVTTTNGRATVQFSQPAPDDYVLTVVGEREEGQEMSVGLVVGGHPLNMVFDNRGKLSGMSLIDGKGMGENETAVRRGSLLGSRRKYSIDCEVHPTQVVVRLDGQPLCQWSGNAEQLSVGPMAASRDPDKMNVSTNNSTHRFSQIVLTPLLGRSAGGVAMTKAGRDDAPRFAPTAPRLPQPDEAARKAAVTLIKDVYKEDFAKAKKPPEKIALAEKLLQQAGEEPEPAQKFALLAEAINLAQSAAAPALVAKTFAEIGRRYELDEPKMLAASLDKLAERSLPKEGWTELSDTARSAIVGAIAAENFDTAAHLSALAVTGAKKAGNQDLARQLAAQGQEIAHEARLFQAAEEAKKTLAASPDDADANLALGVYLCLVRGNWPVGAPHLAEGADPALKQLAQQELQSPTDTAAQVKLADAWWDLAETAKNGMTMKASYHRRAAYWYQQAGGNLSGLSKARAEKRIKEATSR